MENAVCLETTGYTFRISSDIRYLRKRLERACLKSDQSVIREILTDVARQEISDEHELYEDISFVSYLLHILIFNLQNGEEKIQKIFKDNPQGYACLYKISSYKELRTWIYRLRNGICDQVNIKDGSTQKHLIIMVKQYIDSNVDEKITLHDTADKFKISQTYLSSIFAQYSTMGFNDYVNYKKIEKAKKMLSKTNVKVQDIAEELGYSNSFYFSRVFKKMENISPRDYRMSHIVQKGNDHD